MPPESTAPGEGEGERPAPAPFLGETFRRASGLARDLRRAGFTVEIQPEPRKLRKGLEQASRQKARFALIIGENEVRENRYALKDLESGQQREVTRETIIEVLRA